MGGTCTGEHGVGQGKQKYLKAELGAEALDAMRALKEALDPQNIFNPGKIVPAAERPLARRAGCHEPSSVLPPRTELSVSLPVPIPVNFRWLTGCGLREGCDV